jgi:hypothetical protein
MFHRIALAAFLIGLLVPPVSAQKDKPKPSGLLTWETVAADKATKMTTRRAPVPGGWLVLVQIDEELSLVFLPDAGHRWLMDGSPSDVKPGKPTSEDAANGVLDKLKAELEKARAAALAERDEAEAARRRADEERKRALDQLEKRKKEKKPKTGAAATGPAKEAESKRIDEALGLAAREQADKYKAIAEEARAQEAAARQEAQALKQRMETITQQFQKQLAETTKALEDARVQAEKATAEAKRLQAEIEQSKREGNRLKALLDRKKKK